MLYKSSKCQVVSFVYNGKKSLFRKWMSQFIMGWGRKWSFEILFMLIQLWEFVSSLVRLGREENLHVLINISCHNGRGGVGRGGGGVGRQRRHRFDLERSAAPTREESPPALPPRPLPPSSRPRQTAACCLRRRNKTVL